MAFYLLSNGGSDGPALESISHPSTQQKSLKHPESNKRMDEMDDDDAKGAVYFTGKH